MKLLKKRSDATFKIEESGESIGIIMIIRMTLAWAFLLIFPSPSRSETPAAPESGIWIIKRVNVGFHYCSPLNLF